MPAPVPALAVVTPLSRLPPATVGAAEPFWLSAAATVGAVRLSTAVDSVCVPPALVGVVALICTFQPLPAPVASVTFQLLTEVYADWRAPVRFTVPKSPKAGSVRVGAAVPLRVTLLVSLAACADAGTAIDARMTATARG